MLCSEYLEFKDHCIFQHHVVLDIEEWIDVLLPDRLTNISECNTTLVLHDCTPRCQLRYQYELAYARNSRKLVLLRKRELPVTGRSRIEAAGLAGSKIEDEMECRNAIDEQRVQL
jgi:hypothetical protein